MVIPAVLLKIVAGAVVCGSLASSIAVPTVMSANTPTGVVLHGFLSAHKSKYQDKCRLIVKDEEKDKREKDKGYLLVCEGSGFDGVEFYFYSFETEPQKFTKLEKNGTNRSNQTKVKVKLVGWERGGADFTASNGNWTDLIDKELKDCSIAKNDEGGNKNWSVKCPKDGTDSVEIPLTPIIIY